MDDGKAQRREPPEFKQSETDVSSQIICKTKEVKDPQEYNLITTIFAHDGIMIFVRRERAQKD
jgi:hypothetical protein